MASEKEKFYARTMHTPDDPARAALREGLRSLSKGLIPLHRALINVAKEDYALAYEPVPPSHLIGLLKEDPFFVWLQPLTALIVDIDEMARRDFERADVYLIVDRVQSLFGTKPDATFAQHYVPMLQQSVDVAIGLAAVRQALGKIPPKE